MSCGAGAGQRAGELRLAFWRRDQFQPFQAQIGQQPAKITRTGLERDGYLFSVAYPVGKFELKGQYQAMEDDNGFSAGADYKLGKNTKLFAWYSSFDFDTALDSDYLAVGLEHKF